MFVFQDLELEMILLKMSVIALRITITSSHIFCQIAERLTCSKIKGRLFVGLLYHLSYCTLVIVQSLKSTNKVVLDVEQFRFYKCCIIISGKRPNKINCFICFCIFQFKGRLTMARYKEHIEVLQTPNIFSIWKLYST